MNRRSFLTLALTGCTLGMIGCGRSSAAPDAAAEAATPIVTPKAATALAAPPLAPQPHPINESTARLPNRLEIPAIDVDIPVVELGWSRQENRAGQIFSEWDVAAYAAGWHKNSALPGEGGNVVMSGHNNILGAVFRELDQLKKGDTITVWAGAHLYTYAVDQVVVLPDKNATEEQRILNSGWIGPFEEDRLTLVSCWPRNNNTHRIVVVARPVLTAHSTR
jgi:sortase A